MAFCACTTASDMRSNLKQSNREGTAKQLAERSPGYVSSGESEWTRKAGSGAKVFVQPLAVRTHGTARTQLQEKIAECERAIKYMELALRDPNVKRRDALIRDLNIRYRLLTALYVERGDEQ